MDFLSNARALHYDSPLVAFQRLPYSIPVYHRHFEYLWICCVVVRPKQKISLLFLFWSLLESGSLISDLIDGQKQLTGTCYMLLSKRPTKHFAPFACGRWWVVHQLGFHLGGNILTYSRWLDSRKFHWGGRSPNFCGDCLPLSWLTHVFLRHLKYCCFLLPRSIQHNVTNVVDHWDALWRVQTIRISVDCVMAKNRRVEIALRQGFEGVKDTSQVKANCFWCSFTSVWRKKHQPGWWLHAKC